MTQNDVNNRIREVFKATYFDLGIYRWTYRNLGTLKPWFSWTLVLFLILALGGINLWVPAAWFFAFILIIWLCGIDHFIIGLRIRRMLKILEKENIVVNYRYILYICQDLLPK